MGSAAYVFLRKLIPAGVNDLFIVGDAHQRIYRNRVVLSRCGIDIIGRSRRLFVNYRTTDEIRRYAGSYLKGLDVDDLNGGQDSLRGYRALLHGDEPLVISQPSDADIVATIRRFASEKTSCLVAPTNAEVARIHSLCGSNNIATLVLGSDQVDDQSKGGLRLATMHRVKGLEFDTIFLLDSATSSIETSLDPGEKKEDVYQKAALRFVAATRAKKMLVVFGE
jgi:DNA helicase IV